MTTNSSPTGPDQPHLEIRDLVIGTWALVALATLLSDPSDRRDAPEEGPGVSATFRAPQLAAATELLLQLRFVERDEVGLVWSRTVAEFLAREGLDGGLAHLRTTLLQAGAVVGGGLGSGGRGDWTNNDEVVRSQGRRSRRIVQFLMDSLPALDPDIKRRLSSAGARFLDAGAGAGDISIEMATVLPELHVVALEPSETALRVLKHNVNRSSVAARIDIRRSRLEELADPELYTLVWIPLDFIAPEAVEEALTRARAALTSVGWVTLATASSHSSPAAAAARFRAALWGGSDLSGSALRTLLASLGYTTVHTLRYTSSIDLVICR